MCVNALKWHSINDMNQKSHDSMLLYSRSHVQFFLLLKYRCDDNTVSAVMLTAADIVGPSPPTRVFSHALRWGARVAGAALLIYKLCVVTKE